MRAEHKQFVKEAGDLQQANAIVTQFLSLGRNTHEEAVRCVPTADWIVPSAALRS
jgi:hypothetical protein